MRKIIRGIAVCILTAICCFSTAVSADVLQTSVESKGQIDDQMIVTEPLIDCGQEDQQSYQRTVSGYGIELLSEYETLIKAALLDAANSENNYVDIMITDDTEPLKVITESTFCAYSPYLMRTEHTGDNQPYTMNIWQLFYSDKPEEKVGWRIYNYLSYEETKSYFNKVDNEVSKIVNLVSEDVSDEIKALVVHDYLVYEGEYDYDRVNAQTVPAVSHTSGGFLLNKIGVCDGYSYAYSYILNKMGIECEVVSSAAMNHAWNVLKLNGKHYNVDATWNDPTRDRIGRVGHDYFLISDSTMKKLNHGLCDQTGYTCSDAKYESAFWYPVKTQVVIDGSVAYYISSENSTDTMDGIYSRNLKTGVETKLLSLPNRWEGENSTYWSALYSGLFLQDGYLYYNTATELRRIKTDGTDDRLFYRPDTSSSGYIYGSKNDGNEVKYFISESVKTSHASGTVYTAPYTLDGDYIKNQNPFIDVNDAYYYDAVLWAYKNRITSGRTDITYCPKESCSRGQVVTFLWRMAGEPIVADQVSPFKDVDPIKNKSYYQAILWATENKIASGYSDGTFQPGREVTRAEFLAFQYRFYKSPQVDTSENPFVDISHVNSEFEKAILWASKNRITTGKDATHFLPDKICDRGNVAAFLYRGVTNIGG